MPKTITDAQITGSRGERFVGDLIEEMGYLWHPKGQLEGGLDGWIELRDPASGQLPSEVVLVQSKSVEDKFAQEKTDSFTFTVDPDDLNYWLAFPLPVILIVSRKKTDEAYWVSVKDYFADPKRRATLKVRFDKKRDVFRGKGPQLRELARREAERRALPANAVLLGPVAPLGLSEELREAEEAVAKARKRPDDARLWRQAATRWRELADAMTLKGAARRLLWPALEEQAVALREAGNNEEAAAAFIDLARDKVELDEPSATFDLGRVEWLLPPDKQGFEFDLLSSRANWFEHGLEAVDILQALHAQAKGAPAKRDTGALLVDALILLGRYDEAYAVAEPLRKTKIAAGVRLDLELDWLDAAGERGGDVEADWDALAKHAKLTHQPETAARIKQRRGAFLARRGDVERAQQCYREAAAIWVGVEDAEDQVAEALVSGVVAASINGKTGAPLPFAAGAAAPLARGHAQVAAVRGELLTRRGLGYLVEGNFPDALKHLTMALALSRREGNLGDARNGRVFLARAYEGAAEPVEALRFFVQAGAEKAAAAVAGDLAYTAARDVLRLQDAPPWELATSFTALNEMASRLMEAEAAEIAEATLTAATPAPSVYAPDPAGPARRLLARIVPLLPNDVAAKAAPILRAEVEAEGFHQQEATTALVNLFERDLAPDAIELFKAALLAGGDLPVSIAGWLRDASKAEQKPVVDAAVAGNHIALIECARAGLPETWPELKAVCNRAIEISTAEPDDSEPISDIVVNDFMVSFVGLGEMAKFASHELRQRLEKHLIEVLLAAEFDDLSKVSALIAVAELAPVLEPAEADKMLVVVYPIAEGTLPQSAPAEILSHPNPKRARSRFLRIAPETQLKAAALQAAARLSLKDEHPERLERVLADALASNERELVRTALRMLAERPQLDVEVELEPLLAADDRGLREAAERFKAERAAAADDGASTPAIRT